MPECKISVHSMVAFNCHNELKLQNLLKPLSKIKKNEIENYNGQGAQAKFEQGEFFSNILRSFLVQMIEK